MSVFLRPLRSGTHDFRRILNEYPVSLILPDFPHNVRICFTDMTGTVRSVVCITADKIDHSLSEELTRKPFIAPAVLSDQGIRIHLNIRSDISQFFDQINVPGKCGLSFYVSDYRLISSGQKRVCSLFDIGFVMHRRELKKYILGSDHPI